MWDEIEDFCANDKKMVNYSETYYGGMDPEYSSAMSSSVWRNMYFGAPTPATKALQLPEIAKLGMSGIQNVEIGVLDPTHWEAIPKEHFEEMKRLAKLQLGNQAVLSVHAPIEPDPAGFSQNKWDEENRQFAQAFYRDVIDKAQIVQMNEKTPVPVTIHAVGQSTPPAFQWKWNDKTKKLEEDTITLVDPESGQLTAVKSEIVQFPTGEEVYSAQRRMDSMNHTTWLQKRREISSVRAELLRAQEEYAKAAKAAQQDSRYEHAASQWGKHIQAVETDFDSAINNLFDKTHHVLKAFMDTEPIEEKRKKYAEQYETFQNLQKEYEKRFKDAIARNDGNAAAQIQNEATEKALELIHNSETPIYMPMERWAKFQAAKTFSDLAFYSFDKYKEKGPIISVENFRPDMAMGRSESLSDALKQARGILVKRLVEEKKLSKAKAEEIAKQKIGATWDIGHINILKRFGVPYSSELDKQGKREIWEKLLKEEVGKIMGDIKHVHISDNFGYQDVHLPPGMGNVPIKEFLAALEKEGKLGEIKSILESGGFPAHLGIPPSHTEAMMALNMPLYPGITVPGATWAEAGKNYFFGGVGANYGSGYGRFLPEGHFGEYGTGFSQLPYAFGGVRPGAEQQQSKFSGTPMS